MKLTDIIADINSHVIRVGDKEYNDTKSSGLYVEKDPDFAKAREDASGAIERLRRRYSKK